MNRTLAAVLAALVLTAGVAGAVTALPESSQSTPAATADSAPERSGSAQSGETPRLDRLLDRLAERYELTDDQVTEVRATVVGMHEDGASRVEIRRAVADRLESYGVDRAELRRDAQQLRDHREDRQQRQHARQVLSEFLTEDLGLTDEQVAELRETVREARAAGASPAEIRESVLDQLAGYGVSEDDIREAAAARAAAHLGDRFDLTDDQVSHVERTMVSEIESGAYPAEVRAAVVEDLRSFGAIPEDAPRSAWAGARPHGLAVAVQFAGTGVA